MTVAGNAAAIISPDLRDGDHDRRTGRRRHRQRSHQGQRRPGRHCGQPDDPLLAPLGDHGGLTQTRPSAPAARYQGHAARRLHQDQPRLHSIYLGPPSAPSDQLRRQHGRRRGLPAARNLNFDRRSTANVIDNAVTITFAPTVFATTTIRFDSRPGRATLPSGLGDDYRPRRWPGLRRAGERAVFVVDSGVTAAPTGLTITGGSVSAPSVVGWKTSNTATNCTSGNTASGGPGAWTVERRISSMMLSGSTGSTARLAYDGGV